MTMTDFGIFRLMCLGVTAAMLAGADRDYALGAIVLSTNRER